MNFRVPESLFLFYLGIFTVCAVIPYDRAVWWAENIPVLLLVGVLLLSSRRFRFSNTSYVLMSVFIILHTIGGHYTFERVPFDFVSQLFAFERNHYDLMAHFSVGFYAYPVAELLLRKGLVKSKLILYLFPIFTIISVAGAYEIIEWWYAVSADEASGLAMLGSQGDIWDAQKDILADTLGALCVMVMFMKTYRDKITAIQIREP